MKVVSLFDGISCGQVALERAGKNVDQYFSSEINKQAMKVTAYHYPETVQMGDITAIGNEELRAMPKVDLVMGGSPCQDLSVYKHNINDVAGLEGKKSSLFYHYERIVNELNPQYFLLENVVMAKEWENIITDILGVEPIQINSSLVSAAERKRMYWTNIPNITMPEDKGLVLYDVAEPAENVPAKYWYDLPFIYNGSDKKVECTLDVNKGFQRNMKEVYNLRAKANTLLADGDGGNRQKKIFQDGRVRKLMPLEYERLQNLDDHYTCMISDSARYSAIGNGWTVDVIAHLLSGLPQSGGEILSPAAIVAP